MKPTLAYVNPHPLLKDCIGKKVRIYGMPFEYLVEEVPLCEENHILFGSPYYNDVVFVSPLGTRLMSLPASYIEEIVS
jgi:hypothetical protein